MKRPVHVSFHSYGRARKRKYIFSRYRIWSETRFIESQLINMSLTEDIFIICNSLGTVNREVLAETSFKFVLYLGRVSVIQMKYSVN